jgi:hypothetical protein
MGEETRQAASLRALLLARELGHTIPRVVWDGDGVEGVGTCAHCGDGVIVYGDGDGPRIGGTAAQCPCPGETCDHGWMVMRSPAGAVTLRCLHCGAERSEGQPPPAPH